MSAFEACQKGGWLPNISAGMGTLGDRASIGVVKVWDAQELEKPENAKAYLCLVRMAFDEPRRILSKMDRNPNVTLLLLDYLKLKEANDAFLETQIQATKEYVEDRVSAANAYGDGSSH